MELTNKEVNKIIEIASENYLEIECFEGSLLDNYIIENDSIIKIGGKTSKFIIIREKYLNEWSSINELIFTNSINKVNKFRVQFES